MERPFHLPTDVNAEAEEVRYVRAAFPSFVFLTFVEGKLVCQCGANVITPRSWNIVTGREESMGIVPGCYGGHARCPVCGVEFSVTRKVARAHNDHHASVRKGLQEQGGNP